MPGMNWEITSGSANILATDFAKVAINTWEPYNPIKNIVESVNGTKNQISEGLKPEFSFTIFKPTFSQCSKLLSLSNSVIIFTPDIGEDLLFADMKLYCSKDQYNGLNSVDSMTINIVSEKIGEIIEDTFVQKILKIKDTGVYSAIDLGNNQIITYG